MVRKVCVTRVFKIIYRQRSSKASLTSFHLVEEWWQAGAELDHQVPPDLHFSKHQSLCPDIYGCEGLHEEFHPFATAKYLFIETIMTTILVKRSQTAEQQGFDRHRVAPGLRAKLSIRLFQAMKAIFLTVGEELRKPSSSRCSRELMKGPPLCNSCVEYGWHKFYTTDRTELHKELSKWSKVLNTLQTATNLDSLGFYF